jgi:hypothetical protein
MRLQSSPPIHLVGFLDWARFPPISRLHAADGFVFLSRQFLSLCSRRTALVFELGRLSSGNPGSGAICILRGILPFHVCSIPPMLLYFGLKWR